jgi:hypothetical protein
MTRTRHKWTKEEDNVIYRYVGKISTKALAKKINVGIHSLYDRLQYLKINVLVWSKTDGRYTAAEISRETGIPRGTITYWLRLGKIKGEKVGKYWRINWDGQTIPVPSWNIFNFRKQKRDTCYSCNKKLNRNQNYWCSKRCRGFASAKKLGIKKNCLNCGGELNGDQVAYCNKKCQYKYIESVVISFLPKDKVYGYLKKKRRKFMATKNNDLIILTKEEFLLGDVDILCPHCTKPFKIGISEAALDSVFKRGHVLEKLYSLTKTEAAFFNVLYDKQGQWITSEEWMKLVGLKQTYRNRHYFSVYFHRLRKKLISSAWRVDCKGIVGNHIYQLARKLESDISSNGVALDGTAKHNLTYSA